jgi:hypothetical protein
MKYNFFFRNIKQTYIIFFTEVSPLVGLRVQTSIVGQAALKTDSSKVVKHEKIYSDNQHIFIFFT